MGNASGPAVWLVIRDTSSGFTSLRRGGSPASNNLTHFQLLSAYTMSVLAVLTCQVTHGPCSGDMYDI